MFDWLHEHRTAIQWMLATSVGMILAAATMGSIMINRMPADYFTHKERPPRSPRGHAGGTWARYAIAAVGWVVLAAGIAMLVLPGPGLVLIVIGLAMVQFLGKYSIEQWLVSRRAILRTLNWMRKKFGKEPFHAVPRRRKTAV